MLNIYDSRQVTYKINKYTATKNLYFTIHFKFLNKKINGDQLTVIVKEQQRKFYDGLKMNVRVSQDIL